MTRGLHAGANARRRRLLRLDQPAREREIACGDRPRDERGELGAELRRILACTVRNRLGIVWNACFRVIPRMVTWAVWWWIAGAVFRDRPRLYVLRAPSIPMRFRRSSDFWVFAPLFVADHEGGLSDLAARDCRERSSEFSEDSRP